ncbi:MAG TPA: UDP-N-acetylmuramoyl-L-alanine--D-glutamate ligase [Acidimicrobiales bacterium]|nr:UDP-N-acetylmuramoyl-L-alanine--D-glutamate ligase [Acidimicrobiales bacterium]
MRVFMAGLGVTGAAVVRALTAGGDTVIAYDDAAGGPDRAAALDVELVGTDDASVKAAVASSDLVVVTPGLPPDHPVATMARAAGIPVVGDIELAARRTTTPLVAVTGTNGKSTITQLITDMLNASGRRAIAAGNIGVALIEAIDQPADVYVVEVSSQQLFSTQSFRPAVAVWSNLSPDHLDWHPSIEHYIAAKTRIWANQGPGDIAVVNAEDPVVMRAASTAPGRVVTFGKGGDARVENGRIVGLGDVDLGATAALARPFPHDVANALAASAAALLAGATPEGTRAALRDFRGLPHRIELVGHIGGVAYYDDSKATTPASVVTALRSFPSAVLIAGGKNKGLDLSPLADAAEHIRAVVAIGSAAEDVAAVFDGVRQVVRADSMDAAVEAAAGLARPEDVVLLSPACTSWDAYSDYAARGDDFARAVHAKQAAVA